MPLVGPDDPRQARPQPRAPRAPAAPAGQPAPPPVNPYDTSADPTLQRILALGQQKQADAESEALRLRTQVAIDYGDPELARSLGLGEADIAAAAQNPFSRIAKLAQNEKAQPLALDESENKQNLYYSGHRNLDQSNLSRSLLEDRANASSDVRGRLGGISSSLLNTERGIQGEDISAQEDAAQRLRNRLGDLNVGATGPGAQETSIATALARAAHGIHGAPAPGSLPISRALRGKPLPRLPKGVRR